MSILQPSTPERTRLNRDNQRDILLLRRRGDTYAQIAQFLGFPECAVQYTCNIQKAIPKHRKAGRPSKLSPPEEVDNLLEFVKNSKRTRYLIYQQIKDKLYTERDNIGSETIKYALKKRRYFRRIALRKPSISETIRLCRLKWAYEHLSWS